jgi:hypothetical protein
MEDARQIPDPADFSTAPNSSGGFEKHYLGRFGEKVIAYLGRSESTGKIGNDDVFLVVDSIELGDNPFQEEIGVDFHFSKTPPPPDHVPHWGAFAPGRDVEIPLTPETGPVFDEPSYSFSFTSEIPFEEIVKEFLGFIEDVHGITTLVTDVARPLSPRGGTELTASLRRKGTAHQSPKKPAGGAHPTG